MPGGGIRHGDFPSPLVISRTSTVFKDVTEGILNDQHTDRLELKTDFSQRYGSKLCPQNIRFGKFRHKIVWDAGEIISWELISFSRDLAVCAVAMSGFFSFSFSFFCVAVSRLRQTA